MKRRHFLQGLGTVTTSLAASLALPTSAPACIPPKLIETGWDTPECPQLLANLDLYESRLPFDGTVLKLRNNNNRPQTNYLLSYNAWHARLERLDYYSTAITALNTLIPRCQKLTENFLDLKCQPGTDDWFQDGAWATNYENCKSIARVARDSGCKGIYMDTEHYSYGSPFSFLPTTTTIRDPLKTFPEYQAKVYQRGQEFMAALQSVFPTIHILLTWGYYAAYSRVTPTLPLERTAYALLPSFLDGMLDVTNNIIYDGYEHSYGFKNASQFDAALAEFTPGNYSQSLQFGQYYKPSFGLWLDYNRVWDTVTPAHNFFQPAQWQSSLGYALAKTTKYVWVYSEKPNWYDGTMLADYLSATQVARSVL
jgi:hypothetical protein